jgi:2-polyprenyl-3-methyl-5-hydroxy-6-metoxy-1,4-benzoquinol methylase
MGDQVNGLLSPFLRKRRIAAALPYICGRVLDFGCGVGRFSELVPPEQYTGVDLDDESIALARREYPECSFYTATEFADNDGRYDTIVSLAVIEHAPDPKGFLMELAGRLEKGGRIVLTTPHPMSDIIHKAGSRARLFSREADEEHESLIDGKRMEIIAAEAGMIIRAQKRFLFGINQLFVLERRQ